MDAFNQEKAILVVDDERQLRHMLQQALSMSGHSCLEAASGDAALKILMNTQIDVVISDIDMPNMDGIALTEEIAGRYGADVILMTGYAKDFTYGDAVAKGASDFIQKPFEIKELLIRIKRVLRERAMRAELEQRLNHLMEVLGGVIHALSLSIDARDPYTAGHQRRVADLAGVIGESMGLPEDQVVGIRMAGVIHDLGKIAVPAEILSKPSKLSDIEFNLIKTHPQVGYNILKEVKFPWPIAQIVFQHHERMDGSGYPQGLSGKDILLEARIMAVADVVEAISSHRPYRPALGMEAALEEISKNRHVHYDSDIVDACLSVISEKKFIFKAQ